MTGIPLQQLTADSLPVLRVKAGLGRSRADDRDSITAADSLISLISGGRESNLAWKIQKRK